MTSDYEDFYCDEVLSENIHVVTVKKTDNPLKVP